MKNIGLRTVNVNSGLFGIGSLTGRSLVFRICLAEFGYLSVVVSFCRYVFIDLIVNHQFSTLKGLCSPVIVLAYCRSNAESIIRICLGFALTSLEYGILK